jgi:large subunit ribosomal protein L44e
MKVPKATKRYCPKCKKHTEHKVELAKKKTMGSVHTLGRGSRNKWRHLEGMGNAGRYSRPPGGGKMYGKKQTKKTDFRFTCGQCKKIWTSANAGIRLKKVEFQ